MHQSLTHRYSSDSQVLELKVCHHCLAEDVDLYGGFLRPREAPVTHTPFVSIKKQQQQPGMVAHTFKPSTPIEPCASLSPASPQEDERALSEALGS